MLHISQQLPYKKGVQKSEKNKNNNYIQKKKEKEKIT